MKAPSAFGTISSRPPTAPSSAAPIYQLRHQRFKSHDLDSHDPNSSLGASLRWSRKFPQGRHEAPTTSLSLADLRVREKSPGDNEASDSVLQGKEPNKRKRKRWGVFKWILTLSVFSLLVYGTAGMACSLLVWARGWRGAEVSMIVDEDLLILLSLASFICLLTSIVGLSGSLLNSRPILALYTFLLWPCLASMLVVGYISYKRANFRLDRKLNMVWSRYLTNLDRLRIQENLQCCGYYSPLHQATFSRMCYPRTNLPGCKGPLFAAESLSLRRLYRATFSLVFVHLVNILVSLLCSNHVNVTFGKGLTPRRYRLKGTHVEINAAGAMRELDDLDEYRRRSMKRQLGLGLADMDRDEALRHHQERESLHYSSS